MTASQASPSPSTLAPVSSPAIGVDLAKLTWARPFNLDVANAFDKVAPAFAGDPAQPAAWRDAIDRVSAHPRDRAAIAAVLTAQLEARQAPEPARAAAARLADPRTVVVATGQQAGTFGGPIFTLLKALTAVKLARAVEASHGVPAVAVFWVDAEDHDWNEVAGCTVLDTELAPRTVGVGASPRPGSCPIATLPLTPGSAAAALAALREALPPTEFTDPLIATLAGHYGDGVTLSRAFAGLMDGLLGSLGLVVYDAADPAAKPLVAPLFARELAAPGETSRLATAAGAALETRGYKAQVTPAADSTALFALGATREPIKRTASGFAIGERQVGGADLVAEATAHPERFSPNVLLRPLVQDTLFPTIAYVGGPSEIAYFAQLKDVYAHFGLPMPLIVPRATATFADGAGLRFLQKSGVELGALQARDDSALNRLLEQTLPREVEDALQAARSEVEARMAMVIAAVPAVDATLEGTARSTLGKMTHELGTLQQKVVQAAKRRDDTLRRQFERTRALAFPAGEPQERAVGLVWLMNRIGPALVEILDRELPVDLDQAVPRHHRVLSI
ncbi:MAG: bacillithiol biosynthesis cysteine-adding enzyme BshC [Vicinamibacteraceae bacterium]